MPRFRQGKAWQPPSQGTTSCCRVCCHETGTSSQLPHVLGLVSSAIHHIPSQFEMRSVRHARGTVLASNPGRTPACLLAQNFLKTSCPSSEGKGCSARPCTSPRAADRTAMSAWSRCSPAGVEGFPARQVCSTALAQSDQSCLRVLSATVHFGVVAAFEITKRRSGLTGSLEACPVVSKGLCGTRKHIGSLGGTGTFHCRQGG